MTNPELSLKFKIEHMNVQTVTYQNLSFVNVSKPTDFEMKFLKNIYDFNPLILEDYTQKTQIPKIENYDKYTLLVFRFPVFSENVSEVSRQSVIRFPAIYGKQPVNNRLVSSYVNLFLSEDYLVVLHEGNLPKFDHIFTQCQKTLHDRTEYMGKGAIFLAYKIIDALVDDCFSVVNELRTTIDKIDKELEVKQSQKTLEEISTVRRNLVVFHTMIKPVLPLFKEMIEGKHERLNGKMRSFWGNILEHLRKIMDRTEDNRELIEGISISNESLLTSRTNEIVKFLTVITSIAFPFVVVNNLYSMNVTLPYAKNKDIVWYLFSIIFTAGLIIIFHFRRKKWL